MANSEASQEDPVYKDIQYVRGFPFLAGPNYKKEKIESALDYSPLDGDIIISSYPKTGTTWVQYIVLQLLHGPDCLPSLNEITVEVAPHLEVTGSSAAEKLSSPRFIKFHLPYQLTPKNKNAKYIYTIRNPKDTVVSYYQYFLELGLEFHPFDVFFDRFMIGDVGYGDFFEHLLSWYPHKDDDNVLFVCYEELLCDTRKQILRIAKFLGDKYLEAVKEDEELLNKILENTSFKYLKSKVLLKIPDPINNSSELNWNINDETAFFRKGVRGDWKNQLSGEQCRRMDNKTTEKLNGTKFLELWELWGVQKDTE